MSSRARSSNPRTRRGPSSPRGRGFRPGPSSRLPPKPDFMRGLLPQTHRTIPVPSLPAVDAEVKISNLELIGSYDWVERPVPTIRVPGSPPEWTDAPTPFRVPMDADSLPKCQPFPTMPLLPLFYAVDTQYASNLQPPVDWPLVDILTDRNSLNKLLRWIDGSAMEPGGDFRIDLCLAGKQTVLLNRWIDGYVEHLYPHTYGYGFRQRTTTSPVGCRESIKHHRIVKYNLNGLNMIIRYQVDACVPQCRAEPTAASSGVVEDLSATLSALSITPPSTSSRQFKDEGCLVNILHEGNLIPQADLVELTTISYKRLSVFDWGYKYLQTFLGQVPHLFCGVHDQGLFTRVEKWQLDSDFAQTAAKTLCNIRKLTEALTSIQRIVMESGPQCALTLVCQNGELKVFSRESQMDFLPRGILERFEPCTNTS